MKGSKKYKTVVAHISTIIYMSILFNTCDLRMRYNSKVWYM